MLDLTIYEVGSAIWKDYRKGMITNLNVIVELFEEILREIKKISIDDEIANALRIAIENNLTFYDASYICLARKHGLKLVTQDQDLLKFSEAISVKDLIKNLIDGGT